MENLDLSVKEHNSECKVLCFYLPQFHETPENSKWWGDGYTEWTAVRNAVPYYKGHKQPQEPLKDNYYDLSDESASTWKWQSDLAQEYGVYGFVIYHYWFAGKKMLEKPVEILLRHPEINIRYSLCWDNNEWKRTWYSSIPEVLIPQVYGDETIWKKHFDDLLPYFQDERYIKIDNKPVFHVYASGKIDCLDKMKLYWDKLAREQGFDGIYLIGGDLINRKYQDALDAYYNFEPNRIQVESQYSNVFIPWINLTGGLRKRINKLFKVKLMDKRNGALLYDLLSRERDNIRKKTYRGIFVRFDDTPRRLEKGVIYYRTDSKKFSNALYKLLIKSEKEYKEFVYINSWNEWGEGANLEPDKRNGYVYLQAVKKAVERTKL